MKQKSIPCHYPWTSLYVSPSGDVKHCCSTNIKSLGNLNELELGEIWNGETFRKIRRKIHEGDFDGAFCNPNCKGLRTRQGYPFPVPTPSGDAVIIENEKSAFDNFNRGEVFVNHKPLFLQLEFTNNCNLRCIMCFYEFKPPYEIISDGAVEKILGVAKYAKTVALMGGEVFMNKCDLRFIDYYIQNEGASMGFITNGTFLEPQMIDRIKKFKKLWIQVSIDGTNKEIYEKIRRRGNWSVVNQNFRTLVSEANKLNLEGWDWKISISYVVMASNFSNIPDAIRYAVELNVSIGFYPVKGFHLFEENIFVYSNLLKNLGDWKANLKNARDILEKSKNDYPYFDQVMVRLNDIEDCLKRPKINRPAVFLQKFWKIFLENKKTKKAQGISSVDWRIGHLIELYYNWKTGNSSFRSIFQYVFYKVTKRSPKRNKN